MEDDDASPLHGPSSESPKSPVPTLVDAARNSTGLRLQRPTTSFGPRGATLKDYSTKVVAKQATLRIHALMAMAHPRELCCVCELLKAERLSSHLQSLPNFGRLRRMKFLLQDHIHHMILSESDVVSRARALDWAIYLGQRFYEINNFDGMMMVVEALSEVSVHRLKKTWERLSSRTKKIWDKLHELCKWGGKSLKKLHEEVHLPAVPYLGTILSELYKVGQLPTWKSESQSSSEESSFLAHRLLNFDKLRKIAEQLAIMRKFQDSRYYYPVNGQVQNLLDKVFFENVDIKALKEEKLQQSYELEESKRKMAAKQIKQLEIPLATISQDSGLASFSTPSSSQVPGSGSISSLKKAISSVSSGGNRQSTGSISRQSLGSIGLGSIMGRTQRETS